MVTISDIFFQQVSEKMQDTFGKNIFRIKGPIRRDDSDASEWKQTQTENGSSPELGSSTASWPLVGIGLSFQQRQYCGKTARDEGMEKSLK